MRTHLVALSLLLGCDSNSGEDLRSAAKSSATDFAPISSAVAPRTFFLERKGDRCSIYSVSSAGRSSWSESACPREIVDEERIRFAGQTCVRESKDASRNMPVRCPKWLTWAAQGKEPR
jgi:hypothetical protein